METDAVSLIALLLMMSVNTVSLNTAFLTRDCASMQMLDWETDIQVQHFVERPFENMCFTGSYSYLAE